MEDSKTIRFSLILIALSFFTAYFLYYPPGFEFNEKLDLLIRRTLISVFITGMSLFILRYFFKFKSHEKRESERIKNIYLKTYGTKISVDKKYCSIIEENNNSIIKVEIDYQNENQIFFSRKIPVTKRKIEIFINEANSVNLYVDNLDVSKYYIDTEFIND